MIKKVIAYTDFDGVERKEEFYFGLSESELLDMEVEADGGFSEYFKRIYEAKDYKAIVREVKKLIIRTYGEKSEDGRYFMKSPEIAHRFECSAAFIELYRELATDTDATVAFCKGIMPPSIGNSEEVQSLSTDSLEEAIGVHEE